MTLDEELSVPASANGRLIVVAVVEFERMIWTWASGPISRPEEVPSAPVRDNPSFAEFVTTVGPVKVLAPVSKVKPLVKDMPPLPEMVPSRKNCAVTKGPPVTVSVDPSTRLFSIVTRPAVAWSIRVGATPSKVSEFPVKERVPALGPIES